MAFIDVKDLKKREVIKGYTAQFVHADNVTIAFWKIKKGGPLPEHSHLHEQIAMVTNGIFELVVDGKKKRLKPGQVAVIPGNTKHSGRAVTDCTITDVFYPVREDYRK